LVTDDLNVVNGISGNLCLASTGRRHYFPRARLMEDESLVTDVQGKFAGLGWHGSHG
jgi:hypothetical protein